MTSENRTYREYYETLSSEEQAKHLHPDEVVKSLIEVNPVIFKEKTCTWSQIEDGNDWDTSCGELFTLEEGSPTENSMKFCCFCGARLIEKLYEPEPEEDE